MRLLILISSTAAFFNLYQLQAIYPWLAVRLEASLTQAGWLNMATLLGMMLTAPWASRITRRLAPVSAILVGVGLLIALNTALAASTTLTGTLLVRLGQGVVLPWVLTACVALLAEAESERQRAGWVGYFVAGTIAGSTLSRFYPAWALDALGWAGGFSSAAGVLSLAWLVIAHASRRRSPAPMPPSAPPHFLALLKQSFTERKLVMAYCVGFTLLFTQSAIFTVLGLRLAQPPFEQSASQIGLVYLASLPAIAVVIASPLLYKNRSEALFFWPFIALLWISLAFAGTSYLSILWSVAGFSIATYLLQTLTTRLVSKATRVPAAFASGMYLCFYYAGGALGSALSAFCFSRWGWPGTLGLVGATQLVALLMLALGRSLTPSGVCRSPH
ncbi:MFS transporter [Vreelandella sp. EE22]